MTKSVWYSIVYINSYWEELDKYEGVRSPQPSPDFVQNRLKKTTETMGAFFVPADWEGQLKEFFEKGFEGF